MFSCSIYSVIWRFSVNSSKVKCLETNKKFLVYFDIGLFYLVTKLFPHDSIDWSWISIIDMLGARSVSESRSFGILEYLHWCYLLLTILCLKSDIVQNSKFSEWHVVLQNFLISEFGLSAQGYLIPWLKWLRSLILIEGTTPGTLLQYLCNWAPGS